MVIDGHSPVWLGMDTWMDHPLRGSRETLKPPLPCWSVFENLILITIPDESLPSNQMSPNARIQAGSAPFDAAVYSPTRKKPKNAVTVMNAALNSAT